MAFDKIPGVPANKLARPFADNGTYALPPDDKPAEGRASLREGFPVETQLPLSNGGVAPNRLDFNGLFYLLSSFAFWQQSGGLFPYDPALNYQSPAIVAAGGKLWWCVAPSGPGLSSGPVAPGSNTAYWLSFIDFLMESVGPTALGVPVGTVILYHNANAPAGYFACVGGTFDTVACPQLFAVLGSANLPDYRGLVPRGYDPGAVRDPDGAGRAIGSVQQDAMQPITGGLYARNHPVNVQAFGEVFPDAAISGAFGVLTGAQQNIGNTTATNNCVRGFDFDSSRVVRTAAETRMRNVSTLFCIKHD